MKTILRTSTLLACLAAIPHALADDRHEFQGKYQVGNTYCTVKPIKMAFEVRWAKGKGVLIFFFKGRSDDDGSYIFATDSEGKAQDQFLFDNDRLDTGEFLRADGKTFAIKRVR